MTKEDFYKCTVGLLKLGAMECYYFKDQKEFMRACIAYNLNISELTFYFYKEGVLGSTKEGLLSENVKKMKLFKSSPATERPSLYLKLCGLPIWCIPQIDVMTRVDYIRIVMGIKPYTVLPEVLFKIKVNSNLSPRYITKIRDWIEKLPNFSDQVDTIHVVKNESDWRSVKKHTREATLEYSVEDKKQLEIAILQKIKPEVICDFYNSSLGSSMAAYLSENWKDHLIFREDGGEIEEEMCLKQVTESSDDDVGRRLSEERCANQTAVSSDDDVARTMSEEVLSPRKPGLTFPLK